MFTRFLFLLPLSNPTSSPLLSPQVIACLIILTHHRGYVFLHTLSWHAFGVGLKWTQFIDELQSRRDKVYGDALFVKNSLQGTILHLLLIVLLLNPTTQMCINVFSIYCYLFSRAGGNYCHYAILWHAIETPDYMF